jgi:signal transduction histidine kinase
LKFFKHANQLILLIAFIIFVNLFQNTVYAKGNEIEKNILIISSNENYGNFIGGNKSMSWENSIISSIDSVFIDSKQNINVNIQYLDFNNISQDTYSKDIYNFYKYKYKNTEFDAVITLDDLNDSAFKFMLKYGNELFPNTPIIFGGVSSFDKSMLKDHPLFTGITKNQDIKSTIDVALKLHPKTKNVFVITDKSTYGVSSKNIVKNLIPLYKNKVNFLFSDESDIYKMKKEINSLPIDTIVYLGAAFKDSNGKQVSATSATDILFKDSNIPVYSREDLSIDKQSVGGMMTYPDSYGNSIGKLALRILNGEKPSSIPVTEDTSHNYAFNYNQLQKFHIDTKSLPKGSKIVNEPEKYFNLYKTMIIRIFILIIIFIITLAIFLIILNIYKRKLAEKLLADNESLLQTLINSTPDIIYFKSTQNKFFGMNDATLSLLNITRKAYKNMNRNKLNKISNFTKELLLKFEENDKKTWQLGTIYRTEEIILDQVNDINKIYDTLRVPLYNKDGSPKGLILLGRDITKHKQNERNEKLIKELRYYDELKTNFFSNISHELKTPLNLIFSALQVIELKNRTTNKDKDLEKYTAIMRQNCYRLLRIINNLIDITKINSGTFFMHYRNKDMVFTVENIVMSIVDYVENKGINITFDTDVEEKIMAFDLDSMERIILNLLSNAIKFTPKGGTIEVNIHDRKDAVVISVKDNGIGIAKNRQASIFKKFIQVDKSLSRNNEGSGIGLSLVKELVALHNGSVELESTPNKGSEFKIILPVRSLKEDDAYTEDKSIEDDSQIERIKIEFSDIYDY